jgi:hypothetical protein
MILATWDIGGSFRRVVTRVSANRACLFDLAKTTVAAVLMWAQRGDGCSDLGDVTEWSTLGSATPVPALRAGNPRAWPVACSTEPVRWQDADRLRTPEDGDGHHSPISIVNLAKP